MRNNKSIEKKKQIKVPWWDLRGMSGLNFEPKGLMCYMWLAFCKRTQKGGVILTLTTRTFSPFKIWLLQKMDISFNFLQIWPFQRRKHPPPSTVGFCVISSSTLNMVCLCPNMHPPSSCPSILRVQLNDCVLWSPSQEVPRGRDADFCQEVKEGIFSSFSGSPEVEVSSWQGQRHLDQQQMCKAGSQASSK